MRSPSDSLWNWTFTSVTGSAHGGSGTECQDVGGLGFLGTAPGTLLLAVSDGAGSAAAARVGAEIVVDAWFTYFTRLLGGIENPDTAIRGLGPEQLFPLLASIRRRTEQHAAEHGAAPGDYSATLLGAVLSPDASFFAQVGDGCWVVESEGILGCPTWPFRGEFASETVFANSYSAASHIQWANGPSRCSAIAGFTDGIERLGLHLAAQRPEPGFFGPLFRLVGQNASHADQEIRAFLDSPGIQDLSDDDKSLLIVVRNELSDR